MNTATLSAHPFELAGMGTGPYTFGGIVEMPNLSEDGAAQFGNSDPYSEVRSMRLKAGAGTCACCGMAITVICVVVDGQGDRWGVGSDCVEKMGEPALCDAAKVAVAKRRSKMARDRRAIQRDAEHAAWLSATSTKPGSINRETNAERIQRENAERVAQEQKDAARRSKISEILAPIATVIEDGAGGFCDSIASDMKKGILPAGRGLDLAIEIYAKRHGRRNSVAFELANRQACEAFEAAGNIL